MSGADKYNGPWLSAEALFRLPNVRRAFERNRDPLVAAQLDDLDKSESERRGDQSTGGGSMIRKDKPAPRPRPPRISADVSDKAAFRSRWLTAQREAAFANAAIRRKSAKPVREKTYQYSEPSW